MDTGSNGLEWTKHKPKYKDDQQINNPGKRSGHTLTIIGVNAYAFGGLVCDETLNAAASNDLFLLRLSSGQLEWKNITPKGKIPLPRWKHTATLFNGNNILVIGGYHSSNQRLNDVWIYDAVGASWRQPHEAHNSEAVIPYQLANISWPNCMSPRAAHTTTLIGDCAYVFGGYGGSGYSRRDLDDLYSLNVKTWTWTKVLCKGTPPEKRSGHQACGVEQKMYIFGGWNSTTQFQDLHVLDTAMDPPLWSKAGSTLTSPTWNHASCSVMAIPTWKIFTFGGTSGTLSDQDRSGQVTTDTAILETGTSRWTYAPIDGKRPAARCDTCMAYDAKNSRLIVYGGWADEWLDDVYTLDVGNVVGPPYAVTDMVPNMGPVTGGTECVIHGIDFVNTTDVIVRFGTKRHFLDVPGVYISQSRLSCVSPDYSKFPPGEVEVRVALEGDSFTTTFQKFCYFSVTNAAKSIMFGPGLLSGCAIKDEVTFMIQARDDNGVSRTTGGDEFFATVTLLGGGEDGEDLRIQGVRLEDLGAGKYEVTYTAPYVGSYEIKVDFNGTFGGTAGPVRGSGVVVKFDENASRDNNIMGGDLMLSALRSDIEKLLMVTKDLMEGIFSRVKDDAWSPEEQIRALVKVKENLMHMEESAEELTLLVDRCEAIMQYLREQSVELSGFEERLAIGKVNWEKLQREAPQVQTRISPLMRAHAGKIRADIYSYEQHVTAYTQSLADAEFKQFSCGVQRALELLEVYDNAFAKEKDICQKMLHIANIFETYKDMIASQDMMNEVEDLLHDYRMLWECAAKVNNVIDDWKQTAWCDLDPEAFDESAKGLITAIRRLPKSVKGSDAFKGLDRAGKEFLNTCPLITSLRSPAMRERHWHELMEVVQKEFMLPDDNPQMLLKDLLELNLFNFTAEVEEITDKAAKEARHEETLRSLEVMWSGIEFTMSYYKDTEVPLLRLEDENVEQLESDQMAVQSIVGSRYSFFKAKAVEWQKALSAVSEVTQILADMQRTWSYLEPLFIASEEVRKELPEDAKRFQEVDTQVRSFLQRSWRTRNVKTVCVQPNLIESLLALEKKQERCRKSLSEFLDGKRRQFPRFYFMSEADLLDLLSNSSQPSRVLQHIDKILLATKELLLGAVGGTDRPQALTFVSGVGKEVVQFNPPVLLSGKAESYLDALLQAQRLTLARCLASSVQRYPTQRRTEWMMSKTPKGETIDPAQIILLAAQIDFVRQVEKTMGLVQAGDKRALERYLEVVRVQLADLITLTQTGLGSGDRQRVMCMITMDAHNRDTVECLIREKAVSTTAFQWQSKLRPRYLAESKSAQPAASFNILDATFEYGFEYLGNGPRLVVTPLTDRIYVTATQALTLKMGCAPAGPAGTGKTETTKDLASALGKCCYVFNCTPEMDYQSIGNVFKGLASSGSWGCFDEFNRLIPEVLSVASVQFKAVCDSLKAYALKDNNSQFVTIEGDKVGLDPSCGTFITMNPGYLGRSELPEGLKALFRPITVVVPDLVLICENMLMAEGFLAAKILASKFYGLYSLLEQLLSKQNHYDWGLRAVKSVLVVAGHLKRAEPELDEETLLMRALRDFNVPKIVQADQVVFFGLLNDLFPGLAPPRVVDEDLSECVTIACEEANLWPDELFTLKVMQLDELLDIRHCVFVMGPPGAGKSSCWKVLQSAKNIKYPDSKVKTVDLNPKVMPTEDLYGHISMATREWKDGLLSSMLRDLGRVPNDHPKWMILDGDLDANWIESMNSVMDDNKMLTLASNERIPLKASMRMIFEIRDLNYATPATVSRAGILYISTEAGSQWRSIVGSWVQGRPDEIFDDTDRERVHGFFDRYLPECLKYFATSVQGIVPYNDISLAVSVLRLLDVLLTRNIVSDEVAFETAFVFCLVWGFGSVLTVSDDGTDYRKLFSEWFRFKLNSKTVRIPSRDTVFDYWLDPVTNKFESWKNSPAFRTIEFDSGIMNMAEITVPTAETASVSYWLSQLVLEGRNVMLAGPAGTGKTQIVNGMLAQLNPESRIHTTVNMNFYTSASVLQTSLEVPLQKRTGSTYGPPGSTRLVYFVDDLNLPEVDPYNTQSAIALLRQHIDYGHWYDIQKLALKTVDDCMYVTAMNPTAGSFSVDARLQRHFTTFAVGMPSMTSLLTIYQTFLDGHLSSGGFGASVATLSASIIKGALSVHKEVSETFRKTASNFHYEFNIRHISNVFQGLLVATRETFQDGEKFVHLWLHESERVYGDRLVDPEDLVKFKDIMHTQARKTFFQFNCSRFYLSGGGIKADPLVFCHFADGTTQGDDLNYDQATDLDYMRSTLEQALQDYNEISTTMNLVLFDDAVLHCARIVRIIKQTGGHALLIGVGGSGKQSLSRLAAHICGYSVVQIMVNQSYGLLDFKTDLQTMFNKAGIKQEGVLFLLADTQVSNERFFVSINDLLSSGSIPDLYSRDEKETIINLLTARAKTAGYGTDPTSVWKYFIAKVRQNLHCSLCFSPVGGTLRTRARRFPALVNCTVIDWFQPWPEQALMSVSKKILAGMDLGASDVRAAIENFMPSAFVSVSVACKSFGASEGKYVYTTPKSYLEMINMYGILLAKKRAETDASTFRLQNGVEKLEQAAADVNELETNLKVMLLSAEEKKRVAEGIAAAVRHEREIVELENAKARMEESNVADIQAEVQAKHADASADLAQAEPALMRAMAALDSLDRKDLGNCKTMTVPPAGVEDVFSAVMILLAGVNTNIIVQKSGRVRDKDRKWDSSKKALLGNVNGFLDELKNFKVNIDENTVPEINWKEVRPLLLLEHFSPEVIEKRNSAAAGLCSWVINIVTYYDIVQLVEPKRVALKAANEQLDLANAQLAAVRARVADLQARLDSLTEEYNDAEASRLEAQRVAERGGLKLDLANRLIRALGSEKVRWCEGIEKLQQERSLLVGDCLLAAAFVSYIGPFTKAYRETLISSLNPLLSEPPIGAPIMTSESMDALSVLCTEAEIAEYQTQGLPADRVSAENAAIVLNSVRYPLMVDPQLQAIFWIKKRLPVVVTRFGQNDFYRKLLSAMQEGHPFLVENMGEKIPADIMPVISRSTIRRGVKKFAQIGDQEVELHPSFRLYLHTKLNNPHFPPEVQAETTVVNFSVTQQGLEEQLLALVVRHERSDLASQRAALILQQNLFTIRVQQLEDNILARLADAQGDITEDQALIEELELSKNLSNEIAVKLDESKLTSDRLHESSEKYRPVARRGALMFFVINNLHKIHSYYMFSLNSFVMFFMRGIQGVDGDVDREESEEDNSEFRGDMLRNAGASDETDLTVLGEQIAKRVKEIEENDKLELDTDLPERLHLLKQNVSLVVFNFVRAGLFEKDKLVVATLITLRILVDEGDLDKAFVDSILRGRMLTDVPSRGDELSKWMTENAWQKLKALEVDLGKVEPMFAEIGEKVSVDADDWEDWYNHPTPELQPLPGDYRDLKEFQRLLLLRVLRPDRLPVALSEFVRVHLGEEFITQKPFSMAATFRYCSCHTPVLFVLYPGVDPTPWVEDLGREHGVTILNGMFANISMGQGQESRADETIVKFSSFGGWVFLQNVHLMQTWLPTLEEKLETLNSHPDFRVFISVEPPSISYVKNIPEGLLQNCISVANEPPSDLKANLARAWATFSPQRIERCVKPTEIKGCLFGLSFFHSVMLGRRRFGFQGWSTSYGFNMGDLRICADILENYLNRNSAAIPWQDLRYIFGEIMYGGHITDFFDRRTSNVYLKEIFNERLLSMGELAPKLLCPNPAQWEFDHYTAFINRSLPAESPVIYGLHPNAEIGFLTNNAERLFSTILRLELGVSASDGAVSNATAIARDAMNDLLRRCPATFDLIELSERASAKMAEWDGPYAVVVMQECTRLNTLLLAIKSSLEELQKGLNGQLNMSQDMEDIVDCLVINQVPGRNPFHNCVWDRAWASRKNLSSWFSDLLLRRTQLAAWTETLALPYSVWLPGLINPTAMLTAIKQVTARKNRQPLDSMSLETHVTQMLAENAFAAGSYVEDGILVHGLLMEGARWSDNDEAAATYVLGGVNCGGRLLESRLKQLLTPIPVMYVKAIPVQPDWSPESIGYLRGDDTLFECPVYLTSARGSTFVFLSTLKTSNPVHQWILAGVALLMQSDD